MKKLILFFLLSSKIIFPQTAILDTSSILIGEQVNFTISNTITETNIWPTYTEFLVEGVEIIKEGKLDTAKNIISQNFIITAWDSGSYYIPSISFSDNSKTEGLLLNVQSIILEEGAELADIKQPMQAPIGWSDIWPWLLAFIVLAITIFLLKKYVFNKNKSAKPETKTPADIIALNSLAALSSKVYSEVEIKLYYVRLSEIVRRYLEKRYQFIALELPTNDIIKELNRLSVKSEVIKKINNLLKRSDLAKFAKNKPTDLENTESINIAIGIIEETKIVIHNVEKNKAGKKSTFTYFMIILTIILMLISMLYTYYDTLNFMSSDKNSEKIITKRIKHKDSERSSNSINGVYSFKSSDGFESNIAIINNKKWIKTSKITTGTISDYGNDNTDYSTGKVRGSSLYDSSGMIEIGYYDGQCVQFMIAGRPRKHCK